ncbi:helix-turn-helix transcriptional regulator [Lapidilactobacillus bayanensis]|uniref:helix-turn-helix transcriptional regulator n=1 Tax=Lapidilactobacillus bayanensis TaxID=2485998 RepID=UPI0013DDDAD3|nr:helix-turn-helix transcriptional regulator [Lapidilactobacillus bayanensis]
MDLSFQIKKHREAQHLSQEDLSEKIFVSRQTISNWENERSYPDVQNLLLLGEVFNVSLDELVKGDVKMMKHELNHAALKQWSAVMFGAMLSLAVLTIPAILIFDWWALLIMLPLIAVLLFAAFRIENLKKLNDLRTYQEILAFLDNQQLPVEEKQNNNSARGQKILLVILVTVVFMMITFICGYIALKLLR